MATDHDKPCIRVPCPSFQDIALEPDLSFVPTLADLRQAGATYAGPRGYYYAERDGRVVLLPPKPITGYAQLHDMPDHSVVRDAAGNVWSVQHYPDFDRETWMVPFSDEYAIQFSRDGRYHPLDLAPPLPITPLGVTTADGG